MPEERLPGLAALAGLIHWCEEFLNIVNGPILMFGGGIALVDLLTDGGLTSNSIFFLYAWAISQALGIDTQLLGCFARARHAAKVRQIGGLIGWITLGILLGVFAWQASYVFMIEKSEHISEGAALNQLNIDPLIYYGERAAIAVGLIALSGWTRYTKPKQINVQVRLAEIEADRQIHAAEATAREEATRRGIALIRNTIADARGGTEAPEIEAQEEISKTPQPDPESPPPAKRIRAQRTSKAGKIANITQIRNEREAQVEAMLRTNPRTTIQEIMDTLGPGISKSTASAIRRLAQSRIANNIREA